MAVWVGLLAGALDVAILVASRSIDGDFYRLGEGFVWMIPLGVAAVVLMPAAVLALLALFLRRSVPLGLSVVLLTFIGFLDLCARLPLNLWSSLLLSGGLAIQSARLARPRRERFLRLVWRTTPLLIGLLATVLLVRIGTRAWSEHRAASALPPPPHGARNVLVVVWDTVRASNLSLHGYTRRTTPHLDQLARRGVRFDLAFASSSWTLPSHASLFTGRWPHELGIDWKSPLRPGVPTLAEYLASQGYDTAGFVANLDYCSRESGLARGFVHYEDYPFAWWDIVARYIGLGRRIEFSSWACVLSQWLEKYTSGRYDLMPRGKEHVKGGEEIDGSFFRWLSWQRQRNRPFFAFLNYNDAHTPYEVPDHSMPAFGLRPRSCFDRLMLEKWNVVDKLRLSYHDLQMANDVYDESIAFLDRRLGAIVGELERRGVLDNTLLVVTSDHGEHIGDHLLFFHGCSLYRQLVQVPLVIVDPARVPAGKVITEPVSHRDVPATVTEILTPGHRSPFPGQSLSRFWSASREASASSVTEPLVMETGKPLLLTNQGREPAARGPMKSLIGWGMHYIRTGDGAEELYVLASDPEERMNRAEQPDARDSLLRFRSHLSSIFPEY